jgi:hypothetical protein
MPANEHHDSSQDGPSHDCFPFVRVRQTPPLRRFGNRAVFSVVYEVASDGSFDAVSVSAPDRELATRSMACVRTRRHLAHQPMVYAVPAACFRIPYLPHGSVSPHFRHRICQPGALSSGFIVISSSNHSPAYSELSWPYWTEHGPIFRDRACRTKTVRPSPARIATCQRHRTVRQASL